MFGLVDWFRRAVMDNVWPDLSAEAKEILLNLQRFDALHYFDQLESRHRFWGWMGRQDQKVIDELLNHPDLPENTKARIAALHRLNRPYPHI